MHTIMALWRADVYWFLDHLDVAQEGTWIAQALEQWQPHTDQSVKYAFARTVRALQEGIRNSSTESRVWQNGSRWIMSWG